MGRIEEIQSAIESLPQDEFRRLRDWFTEKDWEEWDKEIEADSKSGKLDFLVREAFEDKEKGKLKEL